MPRLLVLILTLFLGFSVFSSNLTSVPFLSIVLGQDALSSNSARSYSWAIAENPNNIFGGLLNIIHFLVFQVREFQAILFFKLCLGVISIVAFYLSYERVLNVFGLAKDNNSFDCLRFIGAMIYAILGIKSWDNSSMTISLIFLPLIFALWGRTLFLKFAWIFVFFLCCLSLGGASLELLRGARPDLHEHFWLIGSLVVVVSLSRLTSWNLSLGIRLLLVSSLILFLLSGGFQPLLIFAVSMSLPIVLSDLFGLSAVKAQLNWQRLSTYLLPVLITLSFIGLFETNSVQQTSLVRDLLPSIRELKANDKNLRLFNLISDSPELAYYGEDVFLLSEYECDKQSNSQALTGSMFLDYQELVALKPKWEEVLNHWKFDAALLLRDSSLANMLIELKGWNILAQSSIELKDFYGVKREITRVLIMPSKTILTVQ